MIMSGGSKQPRCLPRCDRCFSVLFRRSSSAVVCLLVKRLSHGRKCLQPCCARTASEHSSQTGRPSLETSARAGSKSTPSRAVRNRLRPAACLPCSSGRAPRHLTTASLVNEAFTRVVSGSAFWPIRGVTTSQIHSSRRPERPAPRLLCPGRMLRWSCTPLAETQGTGAGAGARLSR
jgi:hypothetical protein